MARWQREVAQQQSPSLLVCLGWSAKVCLEFLPETRSPFVISFIMSMNGAAWAFPSQGGRGTGREHCSAQEVGCSHQGSPVLGVQVHGLKPQVRGVQPNAEKKKMTSSYILLSFSTAWSSTAVNLCLWRPLAGHCSDEPVPWFFCAGAKPSAAAAEEATLCWVQWQADSSLYASQ